MTVTLEFDKVNKIIEVKSPDTEITIQDLHNQVRDFEDETQNLEMPKIIDTYGKQELGGGVTVGLTAVLYDWYLKFEDRVSNTICTVSGGNLVRYDTGSQTYTFPLAFSTKVNGYIARASSATLQELEAIEFSSFENGVTIDKTNGSAGTTFPIGTAQEPSNNFTDAKTIATSRGLKKLYFKESSTTIETGDDLSDYLIEGRYHDNTAVVVEAGADITNVQFNNLALQGDLNNDFCILDYGALRTTSNVDINVYRSELGGTITLNLSSNRHWIRCTSNKYTTAPVLDFNNTDQSLILTGYSGNIKVINMNAGLLNVFFDSGNIEIDSSCTGGIIQIEGNTAITDSSSGTTVTYLNEIAEIAKQLREHNMQIEYSKAESQVPARNVGIGKLDYFTIKIKNDSDSDFSSPVSTQTIYMHYEEMDSDIVIKAGDQL